MAEPRNGEALRAKCTEYEVHPTDWAPPILNTLNPSPSRIHQLRSMAKKYALTQPIAWAQRHRHIFVNVSHVSHQQVHIS